jgi:hypothetical protein
VAEASRRWCVHACVLNNSGVTPTVCSGPAFPVV